jgi:hypothetical protein
MLGSGEAKGQLSAEDRTALKRLYGVEEEGEEEAA